MKKLSVVLSLAAVSALLIMAFRYPAPGHKETSYWVWRGSDMELVDSTDTLLLYQGDYRSDHNPPFTKRGIAPSPLPGRMETGLLVRLYDIGDSGLVADHVTYLVQQWRNHRVEISEIQLDYDCPSGRLPEYKQFIDEIRSRLDSQGVSTPLSITGLLTWHTDDSTALDQLAKSVSYIAFQLYDTHDPVENLDAYLVSFKHYKHAYKIGVSTSEKFDGLEYPRNENYQGNLVFLNVPQ